MVVEQPLPQNHNSKNWEKNICSISFLLSTTVTTDSVKILGLTNSLRATSKDRVESNVSILKHSDSLLLMEKLFEIESFLTLMQAEP